MKTSTKVNKFPEYVFAKLGKKVKEIEQKSNIKVLNFGPGSPDIKPSKKYISKLQEYVNEKNAHLYPGYSPIAQFQEAIINWYKKRFKVKLNEEELHILNGAKDGIVQLSSVMLERSDEVLVPDPGYQGYTGPALINNAKIIPYGLKEKNGYRLDVEEIKKKVTEKTRLIWINYPSNPTGAVISKAKLAEIVKFALEKDLLIAYDNAYSEITYEGFTAPSILEITGAGDIAVEIGSFSKTFSFAGYRLGYITGNKNIVSAVAKIKSQVDSGTPIPLQKLAAYALNNFDEKWHAQMIKSYKERMMTIAKYLKDLGLSFNLPKAALYIWAKIPDNFNDSEEYVMKLLNEKHILFTPGTAFGASGKRHVRISICTNIDNIHKYF